MRSSYLKACLALLVASLAASTARAQVPSPFGADSDIGTTPTAGSVVASTDADGVRVFTQVGGGDDIWNSADSFNFAYRKFTGDFDVSLKVRDLQGPNEWSKVELMAREGADSGGAALSHVGGDRFIAIMTTRTAGVNVIGMQYRVTTAAAAGEPASRYGAPPYPNCWLRLQRQGDVFILYTSTDGATWTENGREDTAAWAGGALANILSVGLAVTAHAAADTTGAIATYSDLKGLVIDPNSPPEISSILPVNRAAALKAADVVVSFSAVRAAESTNSINANGIAVTANGVDKSSSLQITGTGDQRDVTLSGFVSNQNYTVAITVTDTYGSVTKASLQFDTMSPTSGSFTIEGEDYNYTDATSGQAGLFIDNPQPSSLPGPNTYMDLVSTEGIDVHQVQTNGSRMYRTTDLFVGTETNSDYVRQKYVDALVNDLGVLDYNVGWFEMGEWLNYTQTFPATGTGYYLVYARLATGNAGTFSATLDQVTSGATTSSQTLVGLGSFISPTTGGWQSYYNIPLTDALGVPMVVHLTGKQTVRFTLVTGGVNINYLVFAPTAAPSTQPAALLASNPAKDATGVLPNNPISATITDKDTKVVPSTIKLKLNGADVAATVTPTASGATVFYQSPDFYTIGSTNVVALIFSDNATPAHSITNTWQFTVATDVINLPAAFAKPIGTGQTPGFSARLVKATSTPATQASIATIESLLAGNVPLNVWAFETPQVINYWRSGGVGNFPNDTPNFPGVDATAIDISMEIVAYMELSRGVYRFGVNSDDGFRLTSGATPGDTNLVICQFNAGKGVSDVTGDFLVASNGIYPMRLIYQNGGGDGAVEFFSVNVVTGVRTLINDSTVAGYVKAYRFDSAMTNTITFTTQPASRTAGANSSFTFNVAAVSGSITNPAVFVYQWRKDGVDIVDANRPTYTLPLVALSDAGKYRCVVTLLGYQPANSAEATLTVVDDKTPPTVYSVVGSATLDTVTVSFSETVEYNSASVGGNYSITGLTILSASPTTDASGYGTNVVLTTSTQTKGTKYTLTVNSVTDLSGNPVAANTKQDFTAFSFIGGFMVVDIWDNITTGDAASLQSNQRIIDNQFDRSFLVSESQLSNAEHGDNYGGRLSGYIVAPETGNYTFYIAGDDNFELYLSTDESPANKVMIANLATGWTAYQAWDTNVSQTSASIPLTSGVKYYMAAFWKEGAGGDYVNVAWSTPSSPGTTNIIGAANIGIYVNTDLTSITISQQPTNVTVLQNRTATFSVAATGTSGIGTNLIYQWQKNGVDITNATSASYTTPLAALADNNAKFTCKLSLPGKTETTAEAVLTVTADAAAPVVASIAGMTGSQTVAVVFDELVDSATAQVAANYTVSGATTSAAKVLAVNGKVVLLTTSGLTGTSSSVTVQGVKDLAGNVMSAPVTLNCPLSAFSATDVGTRDTNNLALFSDPVVPGSIVARSATDFDMYAGGSDIWNTADGMYYAYQMVTGDFDVKVRVASLKQIDAWTKAGLMLRDGLAGTNRQFAVMVTPPAPAMNVVQTAGRLTLGGASIEFNAAGRPTNVFYPNAWIRLQRAGTNVFTYWGTNGVEWTSFVTNSAADFPSTAYVGLAATAHNNTTNVFTLAEFRDYGVVTGTTPAGSPKLTIVQSGVNVAISWTTADAVGYTLQSSDKLAPATWTSVATAPTVSGPTSTVTVTATGVEKFFELMK